MEDGAPQSLEDVRVEFCPRCLQAVPRRASRCPACRQPIHGIRVLPYAAGAVSLLILAVALFVMFQVVTRRPPAPVADHAPTPVEILKQEPAPVPADSKPSPPPKPEKRPPLNER
jgi:hypothetical protein